jgi:hypothetical protein
MLRALEQYLHSLVDAVHPPAVEVLRGPFQAGPPWPPARRVVSIHALRIDVLETPPPRKVDGPAFTFQTTSWPINGIANDFTLPPALASFEVLEVEAPAGHLRNHGDDYYVDGATIRFFQAPVGPGEARARVRTAASAGYARRSPAKITLDLYAYTKDLTTADPLIEDTLHIVLVSLAQAPYFADQSTTGYVTSVRFCDHVAHVLYIERKPSGYDTVVSCAARIELVGELDIMISGGAPRPVGVIEALEGEVVVERASSGPSTPLSVHIEAADGVEG